MKYPYWVKHDGIDYPPNTEIPDSNAGDTVVEEAVTEKPTTSRKRTKKEA